MTAKYEGDRGIPARVIGPGAPGCLRVVVGVGVGQVDGGREMSFPIADIPEGLRVPNSSFRVRPALEGGLEVVTDG